MRRFALLVGTGVLVFSLLGAGSCGPRLNVVVIYTDDQRWDTVAYMPNVRDRIAGEGVLFANSFATTPLCCPSRSSFLTGNYAHTTGVLTNAPPFGGASVFDPNHTFAVRLDQTGYATGWFGKYLNHYSDISPAIPPGWDRFHAFVADGQLYYNYMLNQHGTLTHYGVDDADYSTDVLRDQALDFIDEHAAERFLLVYAPFAPHAPATPAARHLGSFEDLPPWRPASYLEPDWTDKPEHVLFNIFLLLSDSNVLALAEARNDAFRIHQLETLLAVDEAVGAILDRLDQLGLADETQVIFTADNGFLWGEHWLGGKPYAYEEAQRVPLAIRDPRARFVPRTEPRLALNIDLATTIVRAAGIFPPPVTEGLNLGVLLQDPNANPFQPWRQDFLIEGWNPEMNPLWPQTYAGVRSASGWKYVAYGAPGSPDFEELYDLASDPLELDNLLLTDPNDPLVHTQAAALRVRLAELLP